MRISRGALAVVAAAVMLGAAGCASTAPAQRDYRGEDYRGEWVRIGRLTADHRADHDRMQLDGPGDDFRKLKFRVGKAPLNVQRVVVSYDGGESEELEIRENISKGGETRAIDLRGGRRSIRAIDFWYDTQGRRTVKAEVTVFGQR